MTTRLTNEVPAVVVLVLAGAGFVAVAQGHWRRGLVAVGLAVLLGGVLRLVLPTRRAGLLAVRGRAVDVVMLGVLGGALLLLASVVPAG